MCNKNKGTETVNEDLKYDELVGQKNCTITIVIESFLPKFYGKYVELNVKFTSAYQKYQKSIPESLHSCRHFIVQKVRKDVEGHQFYNISCEGLDKTYL